MAGPQHEKCAAAAARLTRPEDLAAVALGSEVAAARAVAVARIEDQRVLERVLREDKATKNVVSSAKAGRDCRAWLQAEVKRLDSPPLKADMLKKAKGLYGDRLAVREFNRAWSDIAPLDWKKRGRRKQTETRRGSPPGTAQPALTR